MTKGSDTLYFTYDASGTPVSVTHTNGSTSVTYYYVTNLQGDVMHLFDANGATAGYYTYDAWGNQISMGSSTICQLNPLRYRGYVYDQETRLYYLQSRYYNPKWGRFINADNYPATGQGFTGNNMFAYCGNNPVSRKDDGGESWFIVAGAVFGAVVGAATQIITNVATGNKDNVFKGVLGAALGGATYNIVSITTGNLSLASLAGSAVESTTNEVVSYATGKKTLTADNVANSIANVAVNTATSTVTAGITGQISSKLVKINSGWFKPSRLISSFTGRYARKVLAQTATQGAITAGYKVIHSWLA